MQCRIDDASCMQVGIKQLLLLSHFDDLQMSLRVTCDTEAMKKQGEPLSKTQTSSSVCHPSGRAREEYIVHARGSQAKMHTLISRWSDEQFWRKLCPHLSISTDGDGDSCTSTSNVQPKYYEQKERQELLDRLIDDGYALLDEPCNDSLKEKVGKAISNLELQHSIPATFALLFNETWQLAAESKQLLLQKQNEGILQSHGKMRFNFDMLAWHIDPRRKQVGFSPHRVTALQLFIIRYT